MAAKIDENDKIYLKIEEDTARIYNHIKDFLAKSKDKITEHDIALTQNKILDLLDNLEIVSKDEFYNLQTTGKLFTEVCRQINIVEGFAKLLQLDMDFQDINKKFQKIYRQLLEINSPENLIDLFSHYNLNPAGKNLIFLTYKKMLLQNNKAHLYSNTKLADAAKIPGYDNAQSIINEVITLSYHLHAFYRETIHAHNKEISKDDSFTKLFNMAANMVLQEIIRFIKSHKDTSDINVMLRNALLINNIIFIKTDAKYIAKIYGVKEQATLEIINSSNDELIEILKTYAKKSNNSLFPKLLKSSNALKELNYEAIETQLRNKVAEIKNSNFSCNSSLKIIQQTKRMITATCSELKKIEEIINTRVDFFLDEELMAKINKVLGALYLAKSYNKAKSKSIINEEALKLAKLWANILNKNTPRHFFNIIFGELHEHFENSLNSKLTKSQSPKPKVKAQKLSKQELAKLLENIGELKAQAPTKKKRTNKKKKKKKKPQPNPPSSAALPTTLEKQELPVALTTTLVLEPTSTALEENKENKPKIERPPKVETQVSQKPKKLSQNQRRKLARKRAKLAKEAQERAKQNNIPAAAIKPKEATIEIPEFAKKIMQHLDRNNRKKIKTRIVGGFVRDIFLGLPPNDIDMVIGLTRSEVIAILKKNGIDYKKSTQVDYLITIPKENIDIACIGTVSLEENLKKRDFTVNLLYIEADGILKDDLNIRSDFSKPYLITYSDELNKVFEDKKKFLRFIRISAKLGKELNPKYVKCVTESTFEEMNYRKFVFHFNKLFNHYYAKKCIDMLFSGLPDCNEMLVINKFFPFFGIGILNEAKLGFLKDKLSTNFDLGDLTYHYYYIATLLVFQKGDAENIATEFYTQSLSAKGIAENMLIRDISILTHFIKSQQEEFIKLSQTPKPLKP